MAEKLSVQEIQPFKETSETLLAMLALLNRYGSEDRIRLLASAILFYGLGAEVNERTGGR